MRVNRFRVQKIIREAGISIADLTVTHGGDRVRLVAGHTPDAIPALDYAADVLRIYGYTVNLGTEPWYYTVTKEN